MELLCCGVRTETRAVQEFISAQLAQGDTSREDLMRAVIMLTGEGHKFVEGDVPATRTHLLRSTANSLQLGPGRELLSSSATVETRCRTLHHTQREARFFSLCCVVSVSPQGTGWIVVTWMC